MARITLWKPPAERTAWTLYDLDGNVLEQGPMISEVYCDLCNAEVVLRPVPVVDGYALCDHCLPKVVPNWHKQVSPAVLVAWYGQMNEGER